MAEAELTDADADTRLADGKSAALIGSSYPWYVIAVLVVAYIFSFLDRQILSLLVGPIKRDLGINDTRVSLLQGFAFAIFLGFGGIPIGRLVDTRRRLTIVSAGIAVWSLMTAACGLAGNFATLLLCRVGVGVGEATLTPSAYSLICDSVPPRRLGLGIGIFSIGAHVGSGLALILGAATIAWTSRHEVQLPFIGQLHGWQLVFFMVGLPGLLVALWAMSLREPIRVVQPHEAEPLPIAAVVAYFKQNAALLLRLYLCSAFASMASYGVMAWVPSLFIRSFGWSAVEIGRSYGLVNIVFGTLAVLSAGITGDFLISRGVRNGRLWIMAAAGPLAAAFAAAAPLVASPTLSLILFAPVTYFVTMVIIAAPPALQEIVPNRMRGTATAIGVLVVNLIGLGLGPTAVALVTDYVIGDEQKLRYALALVPPAAALLSCAFGLSALKPYKASRAARP